ncbi:MAG: DUF2807 domain-containing protein [Cyclobacteriaceae bacterium]|nr:DUF2807 domain-containing protein [Cyclobacteriaceae bacterium]MCK5207952.1 DUF2807 domain-containing protein [Cyclobacteriaceae bacterium]MCK5467091.1 DUF2807 domain-containing protein [Cyclobacteriaceae bacterium]
MKKKLFSQTFTFLFVILAIAAFADDKIEKTYNIEDFTKIYLKGPYEVHLRQTSKCGLTIVAKDEYFEKLDVSSSGGELQIELEGKNYKKTRAIELYINFKNLEKIDIEGAVDLQCENQIKTDNLKLEFDGAGNVELNINTNKIIANISGVGNFEIEGETDYHKVDFSGIGNYDAQDLHSKYTIVESNGIGSVKVFASNKFKGEANGIGSVDYYGDPDDVNINATGLGSVNRH